MSSKDGNESRRVPGKGNHVKVKNPRLPWLSPNVREDVIKLFNLRLSEPYLLKLKFIAAHSPESMQQFCNRVVTSAIDRKIKKILENQIKLKEYGFLTIEDIEC